MNHNSSKLRGLAILLITTSSLSLTGTHALKRGSAGRNRSVSCSPLLSTRSVGAAVSSCPASSESKFWMTKMSYQDSYDVNENTSRVALRSDSWQSSKNASARETESKFGVRNRVKQVLAKARNRTGIRNGSDHSEQATIIADAASIGGFENNGKEISVGEQYSEVSNQWEKTERKSRTNHNVYSASAYSPPVRPLPRNFTEIDAFRGDVSAAFSLPPDPLPFTLPMLSRGEEKLLRNGERVQYQTDMGREGSGYVVVDVRAPEEAVWDCLLDFHSYPQTIPTVRDIRMFTNTHLKQDYRHERPLEYEDGTVATLRPGVPSVTRAAFTLSKLRLNIAAIHKYNPHPSGDYMIFTLDPACTNMVLQAAKGVWHTQSDPYGDGEFTRVWLLCELKVSKLLPKWVVDYAAKRAMPRATSWLKPQVEAAVSLWLRKRPNGTTSNTI